MFDMSSSFADKTTSHSTKPASGQVAGYARFLALHPEKQISKDSVNNGNR
jgi:hypothetical protein